MTHKKAIWLVAHFPERPETDERVRVAVAEHRRTGLPLWIFAGTNAKYPKSVEALILEKVLAAGVPREAIRLSIDFGQFDIFDTVQELTAVLEVARSQDVQTLTCVSNALQLKQIALLAKRADVVLELLVSPLVERAWWYVSARILLIPLAYFGVGAGFGPLSLVRAARAKLKHWPI